MDQTGNNRDSGMSQRTRDNLWRIMLDEARDRGHSSPVEMRIDGRLEFGVLITRIVIAVVALVIGLSWLGHKL